MIKLATIVLLVVGIVFVIIGAVVGGIVWAIIGDVLVVAGIIMFILSWRRSRSVAESVEEL